MSEEDLIREAAGVDEPEKPPELQPEMPVRVEAEVEEEEDAFDGLDKKQTNAILALVNEPTIRRAAAFVGVNERTIRRWMEKPEFRKALNKARREAFSHAISLTQRVAPLAVNTLVKVMNDPTTPPGIKVAAAGLLLKFGREGIELDDLAERVESLETMAGAQDAGMRRGQV